MKTLALLSLAAILFSSPMLAGAYRTARSAGDQPACFQNKAACCPDSSCCKGGSHTCALHRAHRA